MSDDAVQPECNPDVPTCPPRPPRRMRVREEIRALIHFAKALERMAPHDRHAHLRWLVDKYGPLP
jgi:hypothetical protein